MRTAKILFLIIMVIILTSCYPITRSRGEVFDQNGKPLEKANVKIVGKSIAPKTEIENITNSEGHFNFGEVEVSGEKPLEINLVVSKSGYKTLTKELKFGEDNIDKIVLELEVKP